MNQHNVYSAAKGLSVEDALIKPHITVNNTQCDLSRKTFGHEAHSKCFVHLKPKVVDFILQRPAKFF